MHELLVMWMQLVQDWGYWGVLLLMAMESSIIPVPSEVVVPPAAIMATFPGAQMTFWGVVLAATVGSYLGSVVMYFCGLYFGRPFIYRFGKYFFMTPDKVKKSEELMRQYSTMGIFMARLLPVMRHLISIPAGMAKVGFLKFSVVTITGSAIWCTVLAWFGNKVGSQNPNLLNSPDELVHAIKAEVSLIILAVLLVGGLYAVMKYLTRTKKCEELESTASSKQEDK